MAARDSKEEYEIAWQQTLVRVEAYINAGETDPAKIVKAVFKDEIVALAETPEFAPYQPRAGGHLGVNRGAYVAASASALQEHANLIRAMVEFIRSEMPDLDAIVELGAGTGYNLFLLRDELRDEQFRSISYYACEYTETGQEVCKRLCAVGGVMNVYVHYFDYKRPELGFLTGSDNVLFFTCHSIEQMTCLPQTVIEEMLRRSSKAACFHFEPVGWQSDPALLAERDVRDRRFGSLSDVVYKTGWRLWALRLRLQRILGSPYKGARGINPKDVTVGDSRNVSRNAGIWSGLRNYNKNLIPLLTEMERRGRIRLFRFDINCSGSNPFNPSSLLAWRKVERE